jgi:hypothetical protein
MLDADLARLLDEWALRRAAEGVDRRDRELWGSVMTDDCVIEGPGYRLAGRARILETLNLLAERYVATQHRVHNQVVVIEHETASGETYSIADHLFVSAEKQYVLSWAIRYQDRWRCENRQWRFTSRVLVLDWTETRAVQKPG